MVEELPLQLFYDMSKDVVPGSGSSICWLLRVPPAQQSINSVEISLACGDQRALQAEPCFLIPGSIIQPGVWKLFSHHLRVEAGTARLGFEIVLNFGLEGGGGGTLNSSHPLFFNFGGSNEKDRKLVIDGASNIIVKVHELSPNMSFVGPGNVIVDASSDKSANQADAKHVSTGFDPEAPLLEIPLTPARRTVPHAQAPDLENFDNCGPGKRDPLTIKVMNKYALTYTGVALAFAGAVTAGAEMKLDKTPISDLAHRSRVGVADMLRGQSLVDYQKEFARVEKNDAGTVSVKISSADELQSFLLTLDDLAKVKEFTNHGSLFVDASAYPGKIEFTSSQLNELRTTFREVVIFDGDVTTVVRKDLSGPRPLDKSVLPVMAMASGLSLVGLAAWNGRRKKAKSNGDGNEASGEPEAGESG